MQTWKFNTRQYLLQFRDKLLDRLQSLIMQEQNYNFLVDQYTLTEFGEYLDKEDVREAIHVGETEFQSNNNALHIKLLPEFLDEMHSKIEELLEHYKILIYWSVSNSCMRRSPSAHDSGDEFCTL